MKYLAKYKKKEDIPGDFFCCQKTIDYFEKHKNDTLIVYPYTSFKTKASCECGNYHSIVIVMRMDTDSDGSTAIETRLIDIDEKPLPMNEGEQHVN